MADHRRRITTRGSFNIFLVTLTISLAITGLAADYGPGATGLWGVVWQSMSISVVATLAVSWLMADRDVVQGDDSAEHGEYEPGGAAGAHVSASLEKQGITAKLLELIALGDRYGNVFSVALISVDHLDDIYEQYEPSVPDQLLGKVSSALAHTLRMPDRMGEIERGMYLVVLPETNLPGAIQIAERLREAVTDLDVPVSGKVHTHTTASVGVTSFRRGDDLKGLLERAQRTLEKAQKQGRNRVLPDLAA